MSSTDVRSLSFTLLLAALVTLAAFATDMGLPVLGDTARSLGVPPGRAALTLSVFMAGFAVAPLLAGPLSDHFGRRPVLLVSCAAFAAFGALAAFAGSLDALLAWRFLMGAGAGGCQVLVVAMIRDLFAGPEARVRQSYVNLAAGIAPIIAPTLGVVVASGGGWRAIYGVLAAGGVVLLALASLRIRESVTRRSNTRLTLGRTLRSYRRVLTHPVSLGYALVVALNFSCLFAFVSGSSLVMIELLGVSRGTYGLLFASVAAGLMVGALLSARLTRLGVSHHRLIAAGLAAIVGTAAVLAMLSWAEALTVSVLVPLAVIGFIGQGIVRPHAAQGALEPMPEIAGVASAVLSGMQMIGGATASAIVASTFNGRSSLAMTGPMAVASLLAAAAYFGIARPAEEVLERVQPELVVENDTPDPGIAA